MTVIIREQNDRHTAGFGAVFWASKPNPFVSQIIFKNQVKPTMLKKFWPANLNELFVMEKQAIATNDPVVSCPWSSLLNASPFAFQRVHG
jgi:hypothetical protein